MTDDRATGAATTAAGLATAGLATAERDLAQLTSKLLGCARCPDLVASRHRVVPHSGPVGAAVLFVGEAPGAGEDEAGIPFVGRSGELLDRLLSEVGVLRAEVAVSNVVKCRPENNRTPRRREIIACTPWLDQQVELIGPQVICTLGTTAAGWALGPGTRIGQARGQVHRRGAAQVVVTYHPSAALRFGPKGAPMAGLRADLELVASLVKSCAGEKER